MNIDIVSILQAVSEADSKQGKQGEEKILVGRNDKQIGLQNRDGTIDVLGGGGGSLPSLVTGSNNMGRITVPTADGSALYFHWGRVVVDANSRTEFDFPLPFPSSALILLTNQSGSKHVNNIMSSALSNTRFVINVDGGEARETIDWFAIGI